MPRGNNNIRRANERAIQERLSIIAPLWRRNWTYQEIRKEVMAMTGRKTYSLETVHRDVERLLEEWSMARINDTDQRVTAELARLDLVIKEAWEMWERSKENYTKTEQRDKGAPIRDVNNNKLTVRSIESMKKETEVRGVGDPRFLDVILRAMQQRIKLLGLDQTTIDIGKNLQGQIEIRYIDAGVPCATSEEEVRTREGLI